MQAALTLHPDEAHKNDPLRMIFHLGQWWCARFMSSQVLCTLQVQYTPYNRTEGPLVRAILIKQPDEVCTLGVAFHHAICDAVSRQLLRQDLFRLYNAAQQGLKDELPRPEFQEHDYSVWEAHQVCAAFCLLLLWGCRQWMHYIGHIDIW